MKVKVTGATAALGIVAMGTGFAPAAIILKIVGGGTGYFLGRGLGQIAAEEWCQQTKQRGRSGQLDVALASVRPAHRTGSTRPSSQ